MEEREETGASMEGVGNWREGKIQHTALWLNRLFSSKNALGLWGLTSPAVRRHCLTNSEELP